MPCGWPACAIRWRATVGYTLLGVSNRRRVAMVAKVERFAAQARATLSALKAQVEAAGGTLANVVKLNTYLVDIRHRNELASIREEFFGKKAPASTLVGVTALAQPSWLIEIEAIAVL